MINKVTQRSLSAVLNIISLYGHVKAHYQTIKLGIKFLVNFIYPDEWSDRGLVHSDIPSTFLVGEKPRMTASTSQPWMANFTINFILLGANRLS